MIERIIEKVREIPTRPGNIGGQNYKYVRLEEVIGILQDIKTDLDKPLPEPVGYTSREQFNSDGKLVGVCNDKYESDFWNIPLYAEPSTMDSSLHYFAKQAEIINIDRLLSSLTILGVAAPDSKEEAGVKVGNLVNDLTRAITRFDPHTRKVITIDDVIAEWNSKTDQYNTWDTLDADERVEFTLSMLNTHGIKGRE